MVGARRAFLPAARWPRMATALCFLALGAKKKRRPDGTPLGFFFTCCGPLTDGVFDYLRFRRRRTPRPPRPKSAIVAGSGVPSIRSSHARGCHLLVSVIRSERN